MSGGAFLPKKDIEGFIDMACILKERFPDKIITYYSMAESPSYYHRVMNYNTSRGSPVIFKTVQTSEMPQEYLKHSWLIYSACKTLKSVGLPIMVAEAQAAGVMVFMTKLRPDLELYLAGTGYFYENVDDISEIIASPPNTLMLEQAQSLCSRYDVSHSVDALETSWVSSL
jgi:glycosyltransferase involved in cell wall biosynthesis